MRLEFELPVVVRAKYGRHTTEKTVMGFVPHVAELQDYALLDAPLALAFEQQGVEDQTMESVEYRAVDGRLWVDTGTRADEGTFAWELGSAAMPPFFAGRKGIADNLTATLRKMSDQKRKPAQRLGPNSLVVHVVEKGSEYRFEPLMGMRLEGDIEAQVVPQIEAFDLLLRDFIAVGGRVHRKEKEPLIRLYPEGQGLSARVERRGHAGRSIRVPNALPRSVGWFRMDDRSGMAEEAEVLLAAMDDPGSLNDLIAWIEVHDRSMLRAAPEAIGIYDLADAMRRHFLTVMSRDVDGEEPGASLGRWLSKAAGRDVRFFKAISGKFRGDVMEDELPPDLEEAFMTFAEDETGDYENFTGTDRLKIFAREVARRWRDRTVSLDFIGIAQGR
ncbi:hypothetical protein HFO56_33705 [Rhizobium laguerreae]|uniref:hypothetical protein n=1 Tax=Rhizobium laguerreae TaxID=1076926 RepID=UPI001C90E2FD|nr:hypothetical protein [Rhizobium laguerreae]MBY3157283.1 hypothetical protein [Rhizobium laguerreae]